MAWLVGFHTGKRCCRVPGTRPAGKSTRRRRSRAGSRSRSRGTRRGPWRCIPLAKTPGPPIARRPCSSSTRSSRSRSKGPGLRGRRSRSHSHRTSSSRWRRRSTRSSRPCRTCTCVEIKIYGAFALNHRVVLNAIDATPARWRGDAGSSALDRPRSAASSPRNDLVKNCRAHPTHWLIPHRLALLDIVLLVAVPVPGPI